MKNIILIIIIAFLTVSCSEKKKKPEYGWSIPGQPVKDGEIPIAFLWYVLRVELKTQKKGPIGPAVALLGTDKEMKNKEGSIIINKHTDEFGTKTNFYTTLEGTKIPLSSWTLLIYDVKTKKLTTINLAKVRDEERLKYIETKIREANK